MSILEVKGLLDPHIEDQRQNANADNHNTDNQPCHHVLHGDTAHPGDRNP